MFEKYEFNAWRTDGDSNDWDDGDGVEKYEFNGWRIDDGVDLKK